MDISSQKILNEMNKKEIEKQIEVLNSTLWEFKALRPRIDEWLEKFDDDESRDYALYLLSKIMYFNSINIRHLLKSLYRDLYRYPIIEKIRRANGNTLDENLIEKLYKEELQKTRFLGVGNPSESGVHLLYYFRQENKIPKNLFVNTDDIMVRHKDGTVSLRNNFKDATRFVFIDDICASGEQATTDTNVKRCVDELRMLKKDVHVSYLMLFGMRVGVDKVKACGLYDDAKAVIELDESYKCFSDKSRYFSDDKEKAIAKDIAFRHGYRLMFEFAKKMPISPSDYDTFARTFALGFGGCELLLSMHHNTPDNSLPIIWFDEVEGIWNPIFKRYNKI